MTNKSAFLEFARKVRNGKQNYGVSLTIKREESEGITAVFCSNPDYANMSGRTNSGATFHHSPEWHEVTAEDYSKWTNHLAIKSNLENYLKTLAAEEGIFVTLVGTTVRAITRNNELGRIIYSLPKED